MTAPKIQVIPIQDTILKSYGITIELLLRHGRQLSAYVLILFAALFVCYSLAPIISKSHSSGIAYLPVAICNAAFAVPLAVAWHRSILLPAPHEKLQFCKGRLALNYALTAIVIFISILLVIIPAVIAYTIISGPELGSASGAAIYACALALSLRLGPVLPAAALGKNASWREVWRRTSGNTFQLLLIGLACTMPTTLIQSASSLLESRQSVGSADLVVFSVYGAAVLVLSTLSGLVSLSFITLTFRHFFPEHAQ